MGNQNKIMSFDFNRWMLRECGGFSKELFIKLLYELPEKTEIRAFVEHPHKDVNSILISHESFPEIKETETIPVIVARIANPGQIITLDWPGSYKNNHTCNFKVYSGFLKTEEMCAVCGKVK